MAAVRKRPGPEGGVRDNNRKQRTATLVTASCRLFLRRGLDSVTIDEIAARARMAKGSFYRYFDDKTALVQAIFDPLDARVEDIYSRCAQDLRVADGPASMAQAYAALGRELVGLVLTNPDAVRLYLQEYRGADHGARRPIIRVARRLIDRTIELTELACQHGLMRPLHPRLFALSVIGAIECLIFTHLAGDNRLPPAEVPAAVIDLFMRGFIPT